MIVTLQYFVVIKSMKYFFVVVIGLTCICVCMQVVIAIDMFTPETIITFWNA